jgi:hypothetical protein
MVGRMEDKPVIVIIIIIALVGSFFFSYLMIVNNIANNEEDEPPINYFAFEINAIDHEITNLSDLYTGFEFDNSTYTVNVDKNQSEIFIRAIQTDYESWVSLNVENATIFMSGSGSGSNFPEFRYCRWHLKDFNYAENITLSFSGKGRAIATDRW